MFVLEATAAQGDRYLANRLARTINHGFSNGYHGLVKPTRNYGRRNFINQVLDEGPEHGPHIEFVNLARVYFEWIRSIAGILNQGTASHCNLAFKLRFLLRQQQGADRVEVAAHAVRERGVYFFRDHLPYEHYMCEIDSIEESQTFQGRASVKGIIEGRQGDPPDLAYGHVSTGQCQRPKRGESSELRAVDPQRFTAPRGVIHAVTSAIPSQPDDGTDHAVFGASSSNMRVMMLNSNVMRRLARKGVARGVVIRMKVMCDYLRSNSYEPNELLDRFFKCAAAFVRFQVADVRTKPGQISIGQTNGILEVRPTCENRAREPAREFDRRGDIFTSTVQRCPLPGK